MTLEYETNPESAVQRDDLLFHDPRAIEVKKDEKKLYYTVKKKDGDFNTALVTLVLVTVKLHIKKYCRKVCMNTFFSC